MRKMRHVRMNNVIYETWRSNVHGQPDICPLHCSRVRLCCGDARKCGAGDVQESWLLSRVTAGTCISAFQRCKRTCSGISIRQKELSSGAVTATHCPLCAAKRLFSSDSDGSAQCGFSVSPCDTETPLRSQTVFMSMDFAGRISLSSRSPTMATHGGGQCAVASAASKMRGSGLKTPSSPDAAIVSRNGISPMRRADAQRPATGLR